MGDYDVAGMRIAVFVTCLTDTFFPETGNAVVRRNGSVTGPAGAVPGAGLPLGGGPRNLHILIAG